ncbi:hypothetical protein GGR42_003200 [Saonia flava]|uniref:Lipocalin-like domain-containing protein n=1 Tax=Saonia flava TaxID=523696 RepID=A0A846R7G4_9FLAO|nr:hypothetical protein [Saonia flava]NJB72709.1 hypothetical protein [Saonia flava]
MKKFISYLMFASLFIVALSFTSCQEEFEKLPDGDEQETISASSSTALLMEKTSSNDGSYDNIVDGTSCFAVQFPYTVEVNGIELTIDSIEDLKLIEEIIDSVDSDDDILEILFPITVTSANFDEIVINSKEELRAIAEECKEGGDDDDIECIDFVYPITLYTFDANLEKTGSVTVNSDMELRKFFHERGENDLISIDFPIALVLYDETEVVVNTNAELAHAIETAKEACDEDDDNDHNDDDFTQERLNEYLVKCPWLIHEVKRDGEYQTEQYIDYAMNFKEDGSVVLKDRLGASLEGTWSTRVGEERIMLNLEFDVLVDFSLEWAVYELEEGKIKLYAGDGDKIIMHKACDIINDTPDTLRGILKECSWVIKKVQAQGEDIDRLLGYEFNFMAEGMVTLSNGTTTSEGTWEITTNSEGVFVMAITMGDEPGVSFEWPVRELGNKRLKFEVSEIGYELILERVCNNNSDDGDVLEIRNAMMGGDWIVALHSEGDMNNTSDFEGYDFSFSAEHKVTVSTNADPLLDGLWRVIRNSEGKLKFYLNLGDGELFGDLTEVWEFVSLTDGRLELKSISGDGTIEVLVFEK